MKTNLIALILIVLAACGVIPAGWGWFAAAWIVRPLWGWFIVGFMAGAVRDVSKHARNEKNF